MPPSAPPGRRSRQSSPVRRACPAALSETAYAVSMLISRAATATRTLTRISDFISLVSWLGHARRCSTRGIIATSAIGLRDEIASRIGQDHVTHRLVIFDVAGATAQVAVERLGNGLLEIRARHRLLRQTLQQNLALVQEAGRAIAALKRKSAR